MIVLPACYRDRVNRWLVNLFTWAEGPCYLGADVWSGNVVYKASAAGLELAPIFTEEHVVFALIKGSGIEGYQDRMIAALKFERTTNDRGFVEALETLCFT